MFCPECETEYREGFWQCSDCGVALVHELKSGLVPLAAETSPDLVAILLEGLENARIPYVITAGTALRILEGKEDTLRAPDPWSARIMITPEKRQEAEIILADARATLRQRE